MGCDYEPTEYERKRDQVFNEALLLRDEVSGMSLADFKVGDLKPILKIMNALDANSSDVAYLKKRISDIKAVQGKRK